MWQRQKSAVNGFADRLATASNHPLDLRLMKLI
jgi:hypothetical protein